MGTRHLAFSLAFALLLCYCSGNRSAGPEDTVLVAVFYSTEGPAPGVGYVKVLDEGTVIVRNLAGKTRRRALGKHPRFRELTAILPRTEFVEELSALDAKRYEDSCADCEELNIETASHEVTIPTEKAAELTPAVREVLDNLDALALAVMKHRLDFHLNIE